MRDVVLVAFGLLKGLGILERRESTGHDKIPSKNDPCEETGSDIVYPWDFIKM